MHRRRKVRVWIAGIGVLSMVMGIGGRSAAAQASEASPSQASPSQTPTVQRRQPSGQPRDFDPVPSPETAAPTQAAPLAIPSQAGVITKENGRFTLRAEASEVRLPASVIDSEGRAVTTLPESAFQVYEDGVLQKIVGFRREDLPVSLGILIDSSGSMYDKRTAVDAAALNLVRLSNPKDEAFLVDFNSDPYIDQDFTSSIPKLQQGLSYVKSSGGTALYDAVIASADYLEKNAKRDKRVLLIVTDGDDNASSATLQQAIRRVQNLDGPAIYCIGLLFGQDESRSEAKHSREVLNDLSRETGGRAYFPKTLKDVDEIAQEVAADIRSQYTIEYHSSKPASEGGYRTIHVEAREKGYRGLEVLTRAGYFPRTAPATPEKPAGAPPAGK